MQSLCSTIPTIVFAMVFSLVCAVCGGVSLCQLRVRRGVGVCQGPAEPFVHLSRCPRHTQRGENNQVRVAFGMCLVFVFVL